MLTKAKRILFSIDGQAKPHTDSVSGLEGESIASS
jgi:hypothetical protein